MKISRPPENPDTLASLPFSWMWKDPALITDHLIGMRDRMAKAGAEIKEKEEKR